LQDIFLGEQTLNIQIFHGAKMALFSYSLLSFFLNEASSFLGAIRGGLTADYSPPPPPPSHPVVPLLVASPLLTSGEEETATGTISYIKALYIYLYIYIYMGELNGQCSPDLCQSLSSCFGEQERSTVGSPDA